MFGHLFGACLPNAWWVHNKTPPPGYVGVATAAAGPPGQPMAATNYTNDDEIREGLRGQISNLRIKRDHIATHELGRLEAQLKAAGLAAKKSPAKAAEARSLLARRREVHAQMDYLDQQIGNMTGMLDGMNQVRDAAEMASLMKASAAYLRDAVQDSGLRVEDVQQTMAEHKEIQQNLNSIKKTLGRPMASAGGQLAKPVTDEDLDAELAQFMEESNAESIGAHSSAVLSSSAAAGPAVANTHSAPVGGRIAVAAAAAAAAAPAAPSRTAMAAPTPAPSPPTASSPSVRFAPSAASPSSGSSSKPPAAAATPLRPPTTAKGYFDDWKQDTTL